MSKTILLLLVTIAAQTFGQPVYLQDKSVQCYERDCPNTTSACKKVVKTSDDKKTLDTEIYCLDAQDMVLKNYHESKENMFGPTSTFESTSFSGVYTSNGGNQGVNININNEVEPSNNNEDNFEDFS